MAASVIMSPATAADGAILAELLRPVEVDEVRASAGREPLPVILEAIASSTEAWTVRFDGELACIWGVVARHSSLLTGRVGVAWMLTTRLVERKAKVFWQICLRTFPELLSRWDELVNAIDARHVQAIRWGKRLGFVLEAPAPFGAAGLPFCMFRLRREDLCVSR